MRRDAVATLVIGLIALWLLTSSIRIMTLPVSSSPQGGGGGLKAPGISIPVINITVPHGKSPSIRLPSLTLPSVPIPMVIIELPLPNMTGKAPLINISLPHQASSSQFNGTGTGKGQGSGSGSSPQQQRVSMPQIPTAVILVILIVVMVASSVLAITSMRGRGSRGGVEESEGEGVVRLTAPQAPIIKAANESSTVTEVKLLSNERVEAFRGWGGGHLLKLNIPPDLPLIWGINEPLTYEAVGNVTVKPGSGLVINGSQITASSEGCYEITGELGGESERLVIRFTDYSRDVENLFKLNVLANLKNPSNLTPREAVVKLSEDGVVKSKADALKMIRIFESVYYGKRTVSRRDYESYLRYLSSSHNDPKVITCG
ncbi:hypothetical protein [Caldivirga maquilingensis]|uniref:DUF4129 domain-containing protein n=1 Tax=Caldivirga maquilingensis (strain ATCC 700844 / DSM 13496 / JCM 10307 / IC-167) TaxID=397948 RepID=A8MD85_CALMQ|nr:hypothetical protein [Caldivirga maquilingensis]ABW01741.1 hypothetical protein Cmaq_0908 [Caldivirga maquilingensis IC-167]